MNYNPDLCYRKSIRLKGYDYSQEGLYFITICVQNREQLFGTIKNGEILLNESGKMVEKWYWELENKFKKNVKCDEYVIMPNHFHCIIEITNEIPVFVIKEGEYADSPLRNTNTNDIITLSRIIQWFKIMTTNEYMINVKNNNWKPFNRKLWQRNYYENIIKTEEAYQNILNYMKNNPLNWQS